MTSSGKDSAGLLVRMTTTNGGVKNAETAAASNFDLYAGDFSCDDDISFENLLQLDNDIDKPAPSTLHQGTVSPSAQICRQPPPAINVAQPSPITGSATVPPADAVVYLLTTSALRPPSSAGGTVYDAVARNDVRPLLRFQISKRPTTTAVVGYGVELGGPIMTVGSTPQQRAPGGLGIQTAAGCDLASITSIGDRIAALPSGCPPSADAQQVQRRLALTTAFNGDLTSATGRSIAAAVVACTSPGARPVKSNQPLSGAVTAGGSKSKSAAAADARQTVQEKNAYEYERVMDILRYYRELVVERKLPGACLPCKRRKSKPLVSADPVTAMSTRPTPLPPPSSTTTIAARTVAVPATQYVRPVAMSSWSVQTATPGMCLAAASSAGRLTGITSSALTSRPAAPQTPTNGDTSTISSTDHDFAGRTVPLAGELVSDEPPSRPSSVELGTVQSHSVNDDLPDCSEDLTRTCSSAPGLCTDDDARWSPMTVADQKTSLERRRRSPSVLGRSRRHHTTLRRSVDLRRFVSRQPTFLHRDPTAPTSQNTTDSGGQTKSEASDGNIGACMKPSLPVKLISTHTTDTVVTKWTKAHLAISGPYQSWT